LNKYLDSERKRVLSGFVILVISFGLVFGMSVAGIFPANSEIERREITTTDGGTAYLIYEGGELLGVDVTGDGEVDDSTDDMSLWGSTKISDTHVGTEMLALDDNGKITFGDDQEISMVYDPEEQSIEWTGGNLDFDGHDIGNIGTIDTEVSISKDQPHVDVTYPDFGAVGDGETDDHQAIMDAIDYAVENNINTVYFPNKVFAIESNIVLTEEHSGLNLLSDGGVIKVTSNNVYRAIEINPSGGDTIENIRIEGLEMDGNKDELDQERWDTFGIRISDGGKNFLLKNLVIYDFSGSGLSVRSTDTIVKNIRSFDNWGHGIGTRNTYNVLISNAITHNNVGTENPRHGAGIDVSDGSDDIVVNNFIVYENGFGMKTASGVGNVIITNGYLVNNNGCGFRMSGPLDRLFMDNVESRENGQSGFEFRYGKEFKIGTISSISDGHTEGDLDDGVLIGDYDEFEELTFDYIKVRDAGRYGLRAYPDDITVKHLDISGSASIPTRFYGDNVNVLGGRVFNNDHSWGPRFDGDNILIENLYSGDTRDSPQQTNGITFYGTGDRTIINCDFSDADEPFGGDGLSDGDVVRDVVGFTTEAKGQATITSGSTSVTINHGLDREPSLGDISVTLGSDLGSASYWYIDSVDDSSFEIVVDSDPEQGVDFGWNVDVST